MNACLGSNSALPIKATEQQLSVVVILELQVCIIMASFFWIFNIDITNVDKTSLVCVALCVVG